MATVKRFPWAFFSLTINCVLLLGLVLMGLRNPKAIAWWDNGSESTEVKTDLSKLKPQLGQRHKLSYQGWLEILAKEAKVAGEKKPENLTILVGDSLSLWFPANLLPEDRDWLNQGISGEKSAGLLKRLKLFDRTQPKTIFVMIGINDLIGGVKDETILANQRQILNYLRASHPQSQIVMQSILPHAGEQITWSGRDKLLAIANSRIRMLNQKLKAIATQEKVKYLELYPLFANKQGNLRPEFSTDGLHLNPDGYLVWSSALKLYSQLEL